MSIAAPEVLLGLLELLEERLIMVEHGRSHGGEMTEVDGDDVLCWTVISSSAQKWRLCVQRSV
jgi:hypothetical protein